MWREYWQTDDPERAARMQEVIEQQDRLPFEMVQVDGKTPLWAIKLHSRKCGTWQYAEWQLVCEELLEPLLAGSQPGGACIWEQRWDGGPWWPTCLPPSDRVWESSDEFFRQGTHYCLHCGKPILAEFWQADEEDEEEEEEEEL